MNKLLQLQDKFQFASKFILVLLATSFLYSQVSAASMLQKNVTIEMKNASIKVILEAIQKQTGLSFFYNQKELENFPTRNVSFKNATVDTILKSLFDNSDFLYDLTGNNILISKKKVATAQKTTQEAVLKGRVFGENKMPISGAMILVEGTQVGAITDSQGDFIVTSKKNSGTINVTYVGYVQQNIPFNGSANLQIKLVSDIFKVDDVTVIAYGTRKARQVVGAVSSVKAEDLKELPTHSLESLLQGRMAGVEINNMSGSPGGGGSIVAIRGYNSLFAEGESLDRQYGTPLYVVDGVPIHAFSSPITGANTLSDLDPSMIESVEVLKDAASAAIYGSRAGNGVILITTKKGKQGRSLFSANASTSISYLPKTPVQTGGIGERNYYFKSLLNTFSAYQDGGTGEYKIPQSYREAIENNAYYTYFSRNKDEFLPVMQDSLNSFYNNSTDWYKYIYQTAKVFNANVQTSGGNEVIQYMIGAGFVNEEGIMINSSFTRANVTSNISVKPTKNMRIDSRTYLAFSDRSRGGNRSGGNSKVEGVVVDPTYESTLRPGSGYVKDNVLEAINNIIEQNNSYSARFNLVGDYEFIKGLKLSVSGSLDFNQQNLNHFEPSTMDRINGLSSSNGTIGRSISLMNENVLNYNFKIREDHNFDLLAGLSFQRSQDYKNEGRGLGGPNDYIQYVGGGWGDVNGMVSLGEGHLKSAFTYASDMSEEQLNSLFGRIAYNYKEKYLLEATVRRDGSSKFGEDVRWATFPSIATGWAFSEEKFMKPLYWLNFGKIRASWGTSGQTFSQRYLAHGLFVADNASVDGKIGMTPGDEGGVLNKRLTWEKSSQYDIGLDLNLFNSRVNIKADYYYKVTSSQLSKISTPGNIYFHKFQWQNSLQTSNEGLELEAQFDIFRESRVQWRLRINGSRNWNKFKKSHNGMDLDQYILGKPLYQISVYKDAGFYNNLTDVPLYYGTDGRVKPLYEGSENYIFLPGERRLVDVDGDGMISEKDRIYAASPLPIAHGGIASEIRWGNFDVNMLFTYSLGRNILKIYDDIKLNSSASGNALLADLNKVNSWTGPNSNPNYPFQMDHGAVGHVSQYSGAFESSIENVNLLRLKQLTIGYNLHDKIAKKLRLKSVRVFLTGENIFLLTNYSGLDPEIVSIQDGTDNLRSYPLPRKFTIGLTVNF